MRTTSILLTILAAILCAGCTALALAAKRVEIRRIEQDWGTPNAMSIHDEGGNEIIHLKVVDDTHCPQYSSPCLSTL